MVTRFIGSLELDSEELQFYFSQILLIPLMTTTKEKPANPVPQLDGYSKRVLKNCFALLVGKRNKNFYRRGDLILIKLFVTKFSWMKIIIVVLIEIQTENVLQKHFFRQLSISYIRICS